MGTTIFAPKCMIQTPPAVREGVGVLRVGFLGANAMF